MKQTKSQEIADYVSFGLMVAGGILLAIFGATAKIPGIVLFVSGWLLLTVIKAALPKIRHGLESWLTTLWPIILTVRQNPALSVSFALWVVATSFFGYLLRLGFDYNPLGSGYYHLVLLASPAVLLLTRREAPGSIGLVSVRETLARQRSRILLGSAGFILGFILAIYVKAQLWSRPVNIRIGVPWTLFLQWVILVPVSEEMFFRGILQTKLQALLSKKPKTHRALLIASAVHVLSHLPRFLYAKDYIFFPSYVPATLANYPGLFIVGVSFVSLLLGYVYRRTGSLYYTISMHSLANLMPLIFVIPT